MSHMNTNLKNKKKINYKLLIKKQYLIQHRDTIEIIRMKRTVTMLTDIYNEWKVPGYNCMMAQSNHNFTMKEDEL